MDAIQISRARHRYWQVLLILILWFFSVSSSFAQATVPANALSNLNAPVIDTSQTLSAAEIDALSQRLRAIHAAGRAQMAIVLVPTTGGVSTFDYALRLAEQWKLGSAKLDNGLLILVAVQDRRMQILTGYGLEAILPDVITSRIIREQMTPAFKEGDYAGGLSAAIERIDQILQMDPALAKSQAAKAQDEAHQAQEDPLPSMFGIGFFLLIFGQMLRSLLGRLLAALVVSGLGLFLGIILGWGSILAGILAVILFLLILLGSDNRGNGGFRGGRRGGVVYGGGGLGGGWTGSSGGGYSGGGGGFGGGGASGSW